MQHQKLASIIISSIFSTKIPQLTRADRRVQIVMHATYSSSAIASNIPCKPCNFRIIKSPSLHAKSAHNPRRQVSQANITNISPTSPTPSSLVISVQHPPLILVSISYPIRKSYSTSNTYFNILSLQSKSIFCKFKFNKFNHIHTSSYIS